MSYVHSIFDDDDNYSIWKRDQTNDSLKSEEVLYTSILLKKTRDKSGFEEKHFFVTKDYLYYKNHVTDKIRGWTKLSYMRAEFKPEACEINQHSDSCIDYTGEEPIFCIRLIRNQKFCDIYTTNKKIYLKYYETQRGLCFQTDFKQIYEFLGPIGHGAFAEVQHAKNKKTGKSYAVKIFDKKQISERQRSINGLRDEINVLRALDHERVNKFYEVHETKGHIYIVLEYLKGAPIFDVAEIRKFSSKEIQHVIKTILEALVYLDSQNIMHRDLKPCNMISCEPNPDLSNCEFKMIDFGLSDHTTTRDHNFKRCGTPGFVAPEVLNSKPDADINYDCKADIYSVGIIMYYMMSGRLPFNHFDYKEVIKMNRTGEVDYRIEELAEYDEGSLIMNLLKRLLCFDRHSRPSAKICLKHPYLENNASSESYLGTKASSLNKSRIDNKERDQSKNHFRIQTRDKLIVKNDNLESKMSHSMNKILVSTNESNFQNEASNGKVSARGVSIKRKVFGNIDNSIPHKKLTQSNIFEEKVDLSGTIQSLRIVRNKSNNKNSLNNTEIFTKRVNISEASSENQMGREQRRAVIKQSKTDKVINP